MYKYMLIHVHIYYMNINITHIYIYLDDIHTQKHSNISEKYTISFVDLDYSSTSSIRPLIKSTAQNNSIFETHILPCLRSSTCIVIYISSYI